MKEEFNIVKDCIKIPYKLNLLMSDYLDLSENNLSNQRIDDLIDHIYDINEYVDQMKENVDLYAVDVDNYDSSAESIRKEVDNSLKELRSSLETMKERIINESDNDNVPSLSERRQFLKNTMKPSVKDLEKSCLDQTESILENLENDIGI